MNIWRYAIVGVSCLLLSACQTIEHRSDVITKNPLPELLKSKLDLQLIWSNTQSAGVGKRDARLRLAVTSDSVVVADYKGGLFSLNRQTGERQWRQSTKANIMAGPAIGENRVFVGTDNGEILAYQIQQGAFLWKAPVMGSVLGLPLGTKNAVFVHVLDGSVVALNAADGQQLWRYTVSIPPLMLRQNSRPVLANNHLLVGFANGKLKSLDPADGSVEWEREIAVSKGRSDIQRMVDISADPVVKDNVVYAVSYQGKVAALEIDSGTPLWERELSSYSGLAVSNNAVYISNASGAVTALKRKSGDEIWKALDFTGRRLTAPALIDDYLVVGDEDGYLHVMKQVDGSIVGRVMVDSKGIESAPIVKDSVIYVLGRSGKVAAYTIDLQ